MKHLNQYIKESIFDDDDVLMDRGIRSYLDDLLKESPDFKVGPDNKHIIYKPAQNMSHWVSTAPRLYVGCSGDNICNIDPKELKKHNLIFQPLSSIDFVVADETDQRKLQEFPCEWVSDLDIELFPLCSLDLSKLEYDVKSTVQIRYAGYKNLTPQNIKAYPKHLNTVMLYSYQDIEADEDVMKDWDCDILVIQSSLFRDKSKIVYGDMQAFYEDKVQKILENNPKAKSIYLAPSYIGNDFWYKIITKGSGKNRKVVKMNPMKKDTIQSKIYKYQEWSRKAISWEP